jgi:adenylate cyclase
MPKQLSELYGVLTPNHRDLDPELWDLETKKLKPEVRDEIVNKLEQELATRGMRLEDVVKGLYLIGSSATRRWTTDSDLDITVAVND